MRVPSVVFAWTMVKKRTAGRERKDDSIRFLVSTEQKREIEAAAAREDLDVSTWLRRLARREARRRR